MNYGWLTPPQTWYPFLSGLPDRVRTLVEVIRDKDIGIVHTNSNMILEGALAAKLAGVPHLLVVHIPFQGNLPIYQRVPLDPNSFARLIFDLSNRIIAVSEPTARSLSGAVPGESIRVIENGLEVEQFTAAPDRASVEIRNELGLHANTPLVVGVGRIHPDKGFLDFVKVAARVSATLPEAHFLLVGSPDAPDYFAELSAAIQALGLEKKLHLLGFRQDVLGLLSQSDVFLLTSLSEGGPYVLLEAMASRCVPVATRCGGIVEKVVIPEETGLLAEVGDVDAMGHHVIRLLQDAQTRDRLASTGYASIVQGDFNAANCVNKLMAVYDEMLREPPRLKGSYAVDLFLQAATEFGYLGARLTAMEERLKQVEHLSQLVKNNPIYRLAKRLAGRVKSSAKT